LTRTDHGESHELSKILMPGTSRTRTHPGKT